MFQGEGEAMSKPLLSVAPENMAEDEHRIADGYRSSWKYSFVAGGTLGVVAHYAETKWVVAVAAFLIISVLLGLEGRLHDLCIRLRRATMLLRDEETGAP